MKMNLLTIICLTAGGWLSALSQGTLILSAGDTFTHQFDTMELLPPSIIVRSERFEVYVHHNEWEDGDSLLVEMFENSTSETPIRFEMRNWTESTRPTWPIIIMGHGWQDLQGVVRITGISGSIGVSKLDVVVTKEEANGWNVYRSTFVAPEPKVTSLIILSGGLLFLSRRRQQYEPHPSTSRSVPFFSNEDTLFRGRSNKTKDVKRNRNGFTLGLPFG